MYNSPFKDEEENKEKKFIYNLEEVNKNLKV